MRFAKYFTPKITTIISCLDDCNVFTFLTLAREYRKQIKNNYSVVIYLASKFMSELMFSRRPSSGC